jgi:hypothetical protein
MGMRDLATEAQILSRYLIGENPPDLAVELYRDWASRKSPKLSPWESTVWNLALGFRPLLWILDGGLALICKYSPLRQRIFAMVAILEVQPSVNHKYFMQR